MSEPNTPTLAATFSERNRVRCESPNGFNHRMDSWSLSDWMTAVVGEIGEAANIVKKLNRVRDGIPGNKETVAELRTMLADELADAEIYLDLFFQAAGIDRESAIESKFAKTSAKIGYGVRTDGINTYEHCGCTGTDSQCPMHGYSAVRVAQVRVDNYQSFENAAPVKPSSDPRQYVVPDGAGGLVYEPPPVHAAPPIPVPISPSAGVDPQRLSDINAEAGRRVGHAVGVEAPKTTRQDAVRSAKAQPNDGYICRNCIRWVDDPREHMISRTLNSETYRCNTWLDGDPLPYPPESPEQAEGPQERPEIVLTDAEAATFDRAMDPSTDFGKLKNHVARRLPGEQAEGPVTGETLRSWLATHPYQGPPDQVKADDVEMAYAAWCRNETASRDKWQAIADYLNARLPREGTTGAALRDLQRLLSDDYAPTDADFETKEGWQVHTTIAEAFERIAKLEGTPAKTLTPDDFRRTWNDWLKHPSDNDAARNRFMTDGLNAALAAQSCTPTSVDAHEPPKVAVKTLTTEQVFLQLQRSHLQNPVATVSDYACIPLADFAKRLTPLLNVALGSGERPLTDRVDQMLADRGADIILLCKSLGMAFDQKPEDFIRALAAERDLIRDSLNNLLARIFRDGGQHASNFATPCYEAHKIVAETYAAVAAKDAEIAALKAENAKLREYLSKVVYGAGGSASVECSMEFWSHVPAEVRGLKSGRDALRKQVEALMAEIADLKGKLAAAMKDQEEFCDKILRLNNELAHEQAKRITLERNGVKAGSGEANPLLGRLGELVRKSFMTCNSNGSDGKRWVELTFRTLQDTQECHRLLVGIALDAGKGETNVG